MNHQAVTFRECVLGPRSFYRRVAVIVLPMIIQNTLTNVVSLLDNVMVGQVGTLPMSAVAIVNQLMFVFNLCVFGGVAGAGIFEAQFYGHGDMDGVRHCLRFKLLLAAVLLAGGLGVFLFAGDPLIRSYIAADTSPADRAATMEFARSYLLVMIPGMFPFTLSQCYGGTLRDCGQTELPMRAGVVAMAVNFVFNALLIFGLFGFPCLGVVGAGIATSLSRFVEFGIIFYASHTDVQRFPYMEGLFRSFTIPKALALAILAKTLPLLINETLWSGGQATLLACYSARGIQVVAATNICNTIANIFNTVFISLGSATGILVGQELGANQLPTAKLTAWRMMALSTVLSGLLGVVVLFTAPAFPHIYNTEPEIRLLAAQFIRVVSVYLPINAFVNAAYFTIRSGGKTFVTFLFDSCFCWAVSIPEALLLVHFTALPAPQIYLIVCLTESVKGLIGFILVKKGVWVKNIVT